MTGFHGEKGENLSNPSEILSKVALFSSDNMHVLHAARQLSNSLWTSKLGVSFDVNHALEALENGIYGDVVVFLKKKN